MKNTVIFDLDGTLADIDIRRDKSLKPNEETMGIICRDQYWGTGDQENYSLGYE